MASYRVYILDRQGIHIDDADILLAIDDAEALLLACERGNQNPWELWQGCRRVDC
jgi:hypothetical protein